MADLQELNRCRLCFSSNNLTDAIFPASGEPNHDMMAMIYACTSVRICFEKDFPCPVCSSCIRIVNQFYAFRSKCRDNDRELKQQRGEKEEDDEGLDDDPLAGGGRVGTRPIKQEAARNDDAFYAQMKQQVNSFLQEQAKDIERRTMAKVSEALKRRLGESFGVDQVALHMTVDEALGGMGVVQTLQEDHNESAGVDDFAGFDDGQDSGDDDDMLNHTQSSTRADKTDWKNKYLTLQRNNELLQKAFKDQKDKMRSTEQQLKVYKRQNAKQEPNDKFTVPINNGVLGFKIHPTFPEVSVEYLQHLNFKSGPGEKGDRNFVSKLAVTVFGEDTMVNSSVTGRPSNVYQNLPPKASLCPQKLLGIGLKLFERVQMEVGLNDQEELMARTSERFVRQVICQKISNMRKQTVKHGAGEEDEYAPPVKRRSK